MPPPDRQKRGLRPPAAVHGTGAETIEVEGQVGKAEGVEGFEELRAGGELVSASCTVRERAGSYVCAVSLVVRVRVAVNLGGSG